ncbi:MAG: hypothetical protein HYY35_07695 [Deltaproteobacteria bacterium]|nr:hypothetical protein [Deltaproteobacteria bacterium]
MAAATPRAPEEGAGPQRRAAPSGRLTAALGAALWLGAFGAIAAAAIPAGPPAGPKFTRLSREARVGQAQPAAAAAAADRAAIEALRRAQITHSLATGAALDDLDRRIREIVARLQLLGGCLILLLLGIFFWLLEISRRIPEPRASAAGASSPAAAPPSRRAR